MDDSHSSLSVPKMVEWMPCTLKTLARVRPATPAPTMAMLGVFIVLLILGMGRGRACDIDVVVVCEMTEKEKFFDDLFIPI